jgi:hypothetical protein
LAGLPTNSFVRLIAADKGFTGSNVLAANINLAGGNYIDEAANGR